MFVYESSVNARRRWVSLTSILLDGEDETQAQWTNTLVHPGTARKRRGCRRSRPRRPNAFIRRNHPNGRNLRVNDLIGPAFLSFACFDRIHLRMVLPIVARAPLAFGRWVMSNLASDGVPACAHSRRFEV